jgi:hypothetical protein
MTARVTAGGVFYARQCKIRIAPGAHIHVVVAARQEAVRHSAHQRCAAQHGGLNQ